MAQSPNNLLPAKKQIQACLPFKPLNSVCTPQANSDSSTKKRRLPDTTSLECHPSAKNLKTEENQHEACNELDCSGVDMKEKHWMKNDKEKFRLMEKEKRENKKLEAKLLKECERIEKEKEKAEKKKLKEDERLLKLEHLQQEKRRKEEARLDEKKKKDEKKEKQEDKVTKEKELMQRFFKTSTKSETFSHKPQDVKTMGPFMDFEVKENMRLAPGSRISFVGTEACRQLDEHLISQNVDVLYLEELKSGLFKPHTSGPTWPLIELDVSILPSSAGKSTCCMRAKLLQFHENYRPAYYGTWCKHSRVIRARRPLCRDRDLLDYDVDSDDEWEEEEPGESLSHSEDEDEDDTEADVDDECDGFFVPHGYLSDGEGCDDDDDDSEHQISPDKRKAQQLATATKWEVEMNKTSNILQPVVIGLHWCFIENTNMHESDPSIDIFKNFKAFLLDSPPFTTCFPDVSLAINSNKKCDAVDKNTKCCLNMPFPETALPDLARLIHGNEWSIKKLVCEFCEFWRQKNIESGQDDVERMSAISKRQLRDKIREMAVYELRPQCCKRKLWYVNTDVLTALNLSDLPVRTQWQWITPMTKKSGTQQTANSVAGSQHSSIKSFMTRKLASGRATLDVPPQQQCSSGVQEAVKDLQVTQNPLQYEAMQCFKQSSELFCIQQFNTKVAKLNVTDNANITCSSSPTFPLVGNPDIKLAPQEQFAPNQLHTDSIDDCIIID